MLEHELLLLLYAHPSSLSSSSLLHPGESATLNKLEELGRLYARIKAFTVARQPTTALSALANSLTALCRRYEADVLALEENSLHRQTTPLALVLAETGDWESLLYGVGRLLNDIARGTAVLLPRHVTSVENNKSTRNNESVKDGKRVAFQAPPTPHNTTEASIQSLAVTKEQPWNASPLLSLLHRHSATGITSLAAVLSTAIDAVSRTWLQSFTAFVIWGNLDSESLVFESTLSPSATILGADDPMRRTYSFPSASLPQLPNLLNESTRLGLLASLSTICLALSVLHVKNDDVKSVRLLRKQLEQEVAGCAGPGEENFPRRIKAIETILSTHLLTLHLPLSEISFHLSLFADTFLCNGSFASSLVDTLSTLRMRVATTVTSHRGVTNIELSTALYRASLASDLDQDNTESTSSKLKAFRLILDKNSNDDEFSKLLVGPAIALRFDPKPALALFLTNDCLVVYGRIWSYLMAIKFTHARLLNTWLSLANAQRLRRKSTGSSEGGSTRAEIQAREKVIRAVWGCMRVMNWWIETLMSHFQSDVIEPALRKVLEKVGEAGGSAGVEVVSAEGCEDGGKVDSGDVGHARWKSSSSARPSTPAAILQPAVASPPHPIPSPTPTPVSTNPPLDFASLTTIHSLYLSTLNSGLLLDSEELSGQVKEMLTTCDEFAARLERWGGDILPGLLDNAGDDRNAQLIAERHITVQEFNETFQSQLTEFFESLSQTSSNPKHRPKSFGDISQSILLPSPPLSRSSRHATAAFHQHPKVQLARTEAESSRREFLPKLLLNLDTSRWFSQAGQRRELEEMRGGVESQLLRGLRD